MGPGDGIQIQRLMDLPTTLETADIVSNPIISSPLQATQPPGPPGTAVRVKSMIQQSPGGKLPSRLPSAHPAHPQRSISHNEVSCPQSRKLSDFVHLARVACGKKNGRPREVKLGLTF